MRALRIIRFVLPGLLLIPALGPSAAEELNPEKSAYFAYVDLEYIFTIEIIKAGTPILNFVSMTDRDEKIQAKNIHLLFGNRQVAATLFTVELDRYQQPLIVTSMRLHPRSSFGVRLEGNFGKSKEIYGAELSIGKEMFKLEPLSKFDFETLVQKVNRLNLASPDFRDDFRVLKLEPIGKRSRQHR